MNWTIYDNYFSAIDIIDACRLQLLSDEACQQLNRIRAYLSEQAAECVSWGRATNERPLHRMARAYEGIDANKVSRF